MAIANRALSSEFIGFYVFSESAKSFDLAFRKEKIKTKCKSFGYERRGKQKVSLPPYLP
jgi:hypothetical protein